MSLGAKVSAIWRWFYVIAAAAFATIAGIVLYGKRKVAEGDAAATLRADRERLREAEESGDDDKVLSEWRRTRRKP